MNDEEQTQAKLVLPVKLTFRVLLNGEPTDQREQNVELPVPEGVWEQEGTVEWHPTLTLQEQQEGAVWSSEEEFSFVLKMTCEEVRNLILNEQGGTAEVDLPLLTETAKSKQLVRGKEGKAQGVIEKPLTLLSWDRGREAA